VGQVSEFPAVFFPRPPALPVGVAGGAHPPQDGLLKYASALKHRCIGKLAALLSHKSRALRRY